MIMGGPRHDEHSQAELDQLLAIREQRLEWARTGSGGRLARFVSFLDRWTARPGAAMTSDYCATNRCAAA
jgi:hypothetical protein